MIDRAVTELLGRLLGGPPELAELKLKPGRRLTLRAVGAGGSAIVKLYSSGRAPVVAERLRALSRGPAEPRTPGVLAVDPHLHLVVLTDLDGVPLREALLAGDLAACARAGEALARWHAFWTGRDVPALQPHTPERELEFLERRSGRTIPPSLAGAWECSTVVHRDLYEEQLLLGDRVALIDLDDAALGPPELDIGNLLAHVDLLELQAGVELAAESAAIVDAYLEVASLDESLLSRCRALTRLRLASIHDEPRILDLA